MNSGYFPSVVSHRRKVQTESGGFQTPFFFGGSQVPVDLSLPHGSYSGAGFSKDTPSKPIKSDKVYHQRGKVVVKPYKIPFVK